MLVASKKAGVSQIIDGSIESQIAIIIYLY
jgi:hypothetical protein